MAHLHHRALPTLREIVIGLPEFSIEQHGVCRGCTLGKHVKDAFQSSEHRSKEILDLVIKEQEALKVETRSLLFSRSVQQPLGEQRETRAFFTSVRRPRWFTQTLRDSQEHVETPRSTFRERRPPKKVLDYMVLMNNILDFEPSRFQEATN
jgi:hypothetical protein